jgi:hypothetical protein
MNPDLIAVLEIESDLASGHKQIDFEDDTIFQVTEEIPNVDTRNSDRNTDLKGIYVDPSSYLSTI